MRTINWTRRAAAVAVLRRFAAVAVVAGIAAAALPLSAGAQDFPSKPVTIVVPFGPGTANDIIARQLAQDMQVTLGQSVVVENRPGATGMAEAYRKQGFPALITPSSSPTLFRVVIGPLKGSDAVADTKMKLKKIGVDGAILRKF